MMKLASITAFQSWVSAALGDNSESGLPGVEGQRMWVPSLKYLLQ